MARNKRRLIAWAVMAVLAGTTLFATGGHATHVTPNTCMPLKDDFKLSELTSGSFQVTLGEGKAAQTQGAEQTFTVPEGNAIVWAEWDDGACVECKYDVSYIYEDCPAIGCRSELTPDRPVGVRFKPRSKPRAEPVKWRNQTVEVTAIWAEDSVFDDIDLVKCGK